MDISQISKALPPNTLPVLAHVAIGIVLLFCIVVVITVALINGASNKTRAMYGHGKRGQGRD